MGEVISLQKPMVENWTSMYGSGVNRIDRYRSSHSVRSKVEIESGAARLVLLAILVGGCED
jgi:hypothetical protein